MNKFKRLFKRIVPGVITGAADNDPAGISTYSIVGATTGYSQIWLMVLATPMLIAVQAMCARLGDVKNKGLAAILKEHFPAPLAFFAVLILIISNTITIGADLAGMAQAASLVVNIHYLIWIIPFAFLMWYIVLFENYKVIRKYFLWLVAFFLSYIISGLLAKPNWFNILRETLLPSINFNSTFFMAAVGILGTTITPYLFFWQTKEEIEEKKTPETALQEARKENQILAPGFVFSNLISIFIMISTGAALFGKGELRTAADAAQALRPLAGETAALLFAIGIIGAGFVAVPILASATAYSVAELFGWRESLSAKLQKAKGFYFVISLSIVVGILIAFLKIDPIKALFYSQILAGILAPILLIFILVLCTDKKIMGRYVNGWFDNFFGILAILMMIFAAGAMFWQFATS